MSRLALVTGAARGIGKAVVERFFEENWRVKLHYNQSKTRARELQKEGDAELVQADLKNKEGIRKLDQLIKNEPVDILVNNAGVIGNSDGDYLEIDDWEETFRVNATAPAVLTASAGRNMEKGGCVVNISSIRGLNYSARTGIYAYCSSKASLANTTASLAQRFAPDVRVNAVAPGFTDTDMTSGLDDDTRADVISKTPMERFGEPEEIAAAVRFLCDDNCRFLTGETLVVDGGYSISG